MDIDMAETEMAYFDFKKQFSVTIINDDEEVESTVHVKSHFFSNQNSPSRKVSEDQEFNNNSITPTKEKKEGKRLKVLKILKDKIKNTSDDLSKINCIHKEKKKSKKSKKNRKEKKEAKEVATSRLKDLEPIEMEPVANSSPSKMVESQHIVVKNNEKLNSLEETDNSFKKYEKRDESNQYVNDLLAKVSESLIHILDAYYNHVANMQCSNNDSRFLLESKRRFTRIKQHFFQLSYCTTNIIILSRENDSQFADEFLKNTVKIAEAKNKKLSVQQIQPIYYELISWVKQKKELQSLPLNSVPHTYNLPELRKQLTQPTVSWVNQNKEPQNLPLNPVPHTFNLPELHKQLTQPTVSSSISSIPYNVIPKVSIYNSDSQNREIRISLEPNLETREENNGNISNHASIHTSLQHYDKTMPPRFHVTEPRYTEFDPTKYYNNQMSRGSNGAIRHSHRPNVPEITATPTKPVKDSSGYYQFSSGYPYRCVIPNCFCQTQNQADVANPMNVRFSATLPSYDQLIPRRNENNNSALNNVDSTRSSVSTDSGFISPQQESSPLESMVCMTPTGEDLNLSVTPLITHVTSLNPRALQIVEGSCHVCGASTKKKCLGCYHVYYCSYQCQRLDWGQHMNICKSKAESRPSPNLVQLIQK